MPGELPSGANYRQKSVPAIVSRLSGGVSQSTVDLIKASYLSPKRFVNPGGELLGVFGEERS
jgi:hypothetical protein